MASVVHGGRFDFDDGGTYCGGWEDGKAHGFGVCTGPKGLGEFSGFWQFGYEVSGVYLWPSGNRYEGQWMSGKRHGLGAEKKGRWVYKGEWTQGFKGRYGVRISQKSGARYEGTWANGLQDGYGLEVYADGGTYHGQVSQGLRNGYGVRQSVPYGIATRYRLKEVSESLTSLRSTIPDDDLVIIRKPDKSSSNRGGFVLKSDSNDPFQSKSKHNNSRYTEFERQTSSSKSEKISFRKVIMAKLRKQKSTGDVSSNDQTKKQDLYRNSASTTSYDSRNSVRTCPPDEYREISPYNFANHYNHDHNISQTLEDESDSRTAVRDLNVIESYMGEWKADKRTGFGIAERSDGLRYEGEWLNNKRNGYGVTVFRDGTREEGKYKNNFLMTNKHKFGKLLTMRVSKIRQRAVFSANNAISAAQTAQQKAEIAISRGSNARAKAQAAEVSAKHSHADSEMARQRAREIAPDFKQPGLCQASRDPIIFDSHNSEKFNQVLQERISTTLPYPTGLDYTTGVPGISAATLYNGAQSNINNSLPIIPSGMQSAMYFPNQRSQTFMQPSSFGTTEPNEFCYYPHQKHLIQSDAPQWGYGMFPISDQSSHDVVSQIDQIDNSTIKHDESNLTFPGTVSFHIDEAVKQTMTNTQTFLRRQSYKKSREAAVESLQNRHNIQASVDDPLHFSHRDTLYEVPSPHLRRRKSLPCIVPVVKPQVLALKKLRSHDKKAKQITQKTEKIIIMDGIRKRITECKSDPDYSNDDSPHLPNKIIFEKVKEEKHHSIPDDINSAHITGLSRKEICYLSSKRRDELRRERYLKENPFLYFRLSTSQYIQRHKLIVGALALILLIGLWIFKQSCVEPNV